MGNLTQQLQISLLELRNIPKASTVNLPLRLRFWWCWVAKNVLLGYVRKKTILVGYYKSDWFDVNHCNFFIYSWDFAGSRKIAFFFNRDLRHHTSIFYNWCLLFTVTTVPDMLFNLLSKIYSFVESAVKNAQILLQLLRMSPYIQEFFYLTSESNISTYLF